MQKHILYSICLVSLFVGSIYADIRTVAGNGSRGFSGDGGSAIEAKLNRPAGVVFQKGTLYIADTDNGCIRKVDSIGVMTTLVGTGIEGFSGDGGPAIQAQLSRPHGLWVDSVGVLYISDTRNNRIRKVDTAGIITTVAGTGVAGFSGDGGPATQAQINRPHGIWVDSAGALYISDTNNHRIRKVDTAGRITTFAGTGVAGFSGDGGPAIQAQINGPVAITINKENSVYISDRTGERIRKIDALGIMTTVSGSGTSPSANGGTPASEADIGGPRGIAVDGNGNLYFSDNKNHRIFKIDALGVLTSAVGNGTSGYGGDGGPPALASLNFPWGVFATESGTLYIADRDNHRIREVTWTAVSPSSDFNADGAVNFQDFLLFAQHFGTQQGQETFVASFDLDLNGAVGFSDFLIFAQAFGK